MRDLPDFDLEEMLRRLVAGGVDFVVIGGIAAIAHASPRLTQDLDIVYATDDPNLEALGRVLVEMGAKLRGVDDDVPFVADARTLEGVQLLTLDTELGQLDVHVRPAGAPPFATLRRHAALTEIAGLRGAGGVDGGSSSR